MKKVLCFGTFDILHEGHRDFFRQASQLGEKVCVVLSRDLTVKQVKGQAPIFAESIRKSNLEKVPEISEVILGSLGDKYKAIREINPEFIALGYDQITFTEKLPTFLADNNLKAKIVRLKAHQEHIYKSSIIREQFIP